MDFLIYTQLVLGFIFLIKGADLLIDSSVSLAKRFNISDIVIGLTIVSFGTSAPELVVNIVASLRGNSELAFGNIVGSNIANILLILGITSCIAPIIISHKTAWKEVPMSLIAGVALFALVNDSLLDTSLGCQNKSGFACDLLGRGDAIILILFFLIFMAYVIQSALHENKIFIEEDKRLSLGKTLFFNILGLSTLLLGGHWIVNSSTFIARELGLSEAVIGITIIGVGTSLPEVAASVVAARKGNSDIAVGNAIGSNVFNILWVLGLSALINPLPYDTKINADMYVMILVSFLFFLSIFVGKRYYLTRKKGIGALMLYSIYILYLLQNISK